MNSDYYTNPVIGINYDRLLQSRDYYTQWGYRYIDAPWAVSEEANSVTCPGGKKKFEIDAGILVGSAEQSFIQMILDGKITHGKYQTLTPCFRDEAVYDSTHHNYFMKLELIDIFYNKKLYGSQKPNRAMGDILNAAMANFTRILYENKIDVSKLDFITTSNEQGNKQHDIVLDVKGHRNELLQIELGSYGVRSYKDFTWVYGTGISEPRMQYVINKALPARGM